MRTGTSARWWLALIALPALADTQIWNVKVLAVERTHGAVTNFTLKFLEEDNPWPSCETVKVQSRLAPEPPLHAQTWSRTAGFRDIYLPALAELREAAATRRTIAFGQVGVGLKTSGNGCTVESNGLAIQSENGAKVIVSYHDPIPAT